MDTIDSITLDAYANWIAEDFGMLLDPKPPGERQPYAGQTKRTAACDNPSLFRAQFELLRYLIGARDASTRKTQFSDYATALEQDAGGGLYTRNPGRRSDSNSFDEYLGLCGLSVVFSLPEVPRAICRRGDTTGGMFNVVDPMKPDVHYWRQGNDVATYKICGEVAPALYELAWLLLGTIWGTWLTPRSNTSDPLLNWLRAKTLVIKTRELKARDKIWDYIYALCLVCEALVDTNMIYRGGVYKVFSTYFKPEHPNPRLAALLK